jgi:hypothetical protein
MRLYPIPSFIALVGWLFVLATQKPLVLAITVGVTLAGVPAFWIWKVIENRRVPVS